MFSGGYIFIEQFQNRKCTCASNRLIIYLVLLYRKIYYSNIYNRVKQCKVSCCLLYTHKHSTQKPYTLSYTSSGSYMKLNFSILRVILAQGPCQSSLCIFTQCSCDAEALIDDLLSFECVFFPHGRSSLYMYFIAIVLRNVRYPQI